MSFFKKISKVAAFTALTGVVALSMTNPVTAAIATPFFAYVYAKGEFSGQGSRQRKTIEIEEELLRQILEDRKDIVKLSNDRLMEIKEIRKDVDHLYELI